MQQVLDKTGTSIKAGDHVRVNCIGVEGVFRVEEFRGELYLVLGDDVLGKSLLFSYLPNTLEITTEASDDKKA